MLPNTQPLGGKAGMQIRSGWLQNPSSYPSFPLPSQQAGPSLSAGLSLPERSAGERRALTHLLHTAHFLPSSWPQILPAQGPTIHPTSARSVFPASVSETTQHGDSALHHFTPRAMMGRIQKASLHSNIHFTDSLIFFLIPEKGIKLERTASLFVCVVFCFVLLCFVCHSYLYTKI